MQTLTKSKSNQISFGQYVQIPSVKKLIFDTLGDKEVATRFITSIVGSVSNNPQLKQCDQGSVVSAALYAESLKLSLNQSLGQAYMVPYKTKTGTKAQFQMGYKGFIQLAIRSGQYKNITVTDVREDELVSSNPFTGTYTFNPITNPKERLATKVVGYFACFTLLNGYHQELYMSVEELKAHAEDYVPSYKYHNGNSLWETNFPAMARKTVLRQILSKWGVMSVEMQKAFEGDMAVINEDGSKDYVDGIDSEDVIDVTPEEPVQQSEAVQYVEEPQDATEYDNSLI